MSALRHLLLTLALIAHSSAQAEDDSRVVCGISLADPGPFTWEAYSDSQDGFVTTKVDEPTLRRLLNSNSTDWPASLAEGMTKSLDAAFPSSGEARLTMAQFRIGKDPLGDQLAFPGTSFALKMPGEAEAPECTSGPTAALSLARAGSFIELVQSAHVAVIVDKMKLTSLQIANLEEQYDKYLFEGFPMFPWEAAVNGWFLTDKSIANGPPRRTIVLLHPSAGAVGAISSDSSSDTGGTLGVEALGMVWYSSDFESWYGASLFAAFPSDREAGYGVALNYNNYKLGVIWIDQENSEHDGATLFLGMDLLQFVGEQHRKYEGYRAKVRSLLDSVGVTRPAQ